MLCKEKLSQTRGGGAVNAATFGSGGGGAARKRRKILQRALSILVQCNESAAQAAHAHLLT